MSQVRELFLSKDLAAHIRSRTLSPGASGETATAPMNSDVDDVSALRAPRRKGHAVVIGIERYRRDLPLAHFAANDARTVATYLSRALGFPAENVVTLINDGATKSDLEKYLNQWLKNRTERDDSIVIYYSGHGAPNPVTGDAYLLPFDGDPAYIKQTGYPLKELYAALGKLPAREVMVILDSCFSGAGGRSVLARGARPLVHVSQVSRLPPNMTVLAASAANQISQTHWKEGHGLFTYFLLKGMRERIFKAGVDWRGAFDWASPRVKEIARKDYNTEQMPQWQGGAP